MLPMAIGFSRSTTILGRLIQLFRGILRDKNAPNHSFFVTEDHGQFFATEETFSGLVENSLEKYTKKNDVTLREKALEHLAEIRRRAAEESRYDWKGILSFLPLIGKLIKQDPKRNWCSENCTTILKLFNAPGIMKVGVAPDELLKMIDENLKYREIKNFYL